MFYSKLKKKLAEIMFTDITEYNTEKFYLETSHNKVQ